MHDDYEDDRVDGVELGELDEQGSDALLDDETRKRLAEQTPPEPA